MAGEAIEQRILPGRSPASTGFEGAHGNGIGHPPQHPGGVDDVLLGLSLHGLPAVERHRRFQAESDVGFRAKEDQSQDPTLQATGELALFDSSGEFQHRLDVSGRPILQGQEITLGHGTFG